MSENKPKNVTLVFKDLNNLEIDLLNKQFQKNFNITYDEGIRLLKTIYSNAERFKERFAKKVLKEYELFQEYCKDPEFRDKFDHLEYGEEKLAILPPLMDEFYEAIKTAEPFSYNEAFAYAGDDSKSNFSALLWQHIDVREMFEHLPSERVTTKGIKTMQNFYDSNGKFIEEREVDNVYELHLVDTTKIGIDGKSYAIKCWCTTTNDEHWLWVEDEFGEMKDPLAAIASTCRVPESWIENGQLTNDLTAIKRQGDVFLFEFNGKDRIPKDGENYVPLTTEQFFGKLKAQA